MSATPPPPDSPRIDVRALSLAQLQKLATRGSRRARAELEGRMRAAAAEALPFAGPREPAPGFPLPPGGGAMPTLTVRADGAALRPPAAPAPTFSRASAPTPTPAPPWLPPASAAPSPELLAEQLQLIAQQQRARDDGPPRLVGLVLIVWGALLLLGGLLLLTRGGGAYYLACGLGSAAVGWLLMRCSRWALALHGALLALALAWAWAGAAQRSLPLALLQAAPLLVAALWTVLRPVRDALD